MGAIIDDFRLALRSVARSPGYAAIAVVTLALGIGATTAIFSVVNGMFLRPLPYPNAERLIKTLRCLRTAFRALSRTRTSRTFGTKIVPLRGSRLYTSRTASAAMAEQGFRVAWTQVSPGFLSVIGVPPALGRGFTADEEQTGGPVAIVSYGYWQNRLAGRSDFASQSVRVNDRTYAVIGVMPRGYDFPAGTDLWAPMQPMGRTIAPRAAFRWSGACGTTYPSQPPSRISAQSPSDSNNSMATAPTWSTPPCVR